MLKGLSLVDLATKIEANRELKRDFIAPSDQITMQVARGGGESPRPVLELPKDHGTFPILGLAHDQIYDRAVEFESMGGNLVELPRGEWKEILEAA